MGDDDEFLALLQNNLKQPVSTNYNINGNYNGTPTTANPAELSVLRTISPLNTESSGSPSPPSANATTSATTAATTIDPDHDSGLLQTPLSAQSSTFNDLSWSNHQRQMSSSASRATRSAAAAASRDDGPSKRKILDDLDEESDDDEPQRKVQHTDANCTSSYLPASRSLFIISSLHIVHFTTFYPDPPFPSAPIFITTYFLLDLRR